MKDVKIGGQTYTDIDRLEFVDADTNENVYFMEAEILLCILQNANVSGDGPISYYENPYLTKIGKDAEWHTQFFDTLYLPNVTISQTGAKTNCRYAIFPKLTEASNQLFYGDRLKIVDLSALTTITGTYSFAIKYTALILRGNTVPTFANSNINNYKTGVTVYVPQNMISAYEANSVWASLVSTKQWTFTALEGSEYEDPNWFKQ